MSRVRRRIALGSAVSLFFLGTLVTSTVGTASANHVIACGSTITADTKLQANIGPCPDGGGVVVTGSGIDVNLNGYRVFSNSTLPRNVGVGDNGVWMPADVVGIKLVNATGTTVRNGTVSGFSAGVSIEGGSSNVVKNLTVQNNQGPCVSEDFSAFVPNSYGDGIAVFGSQNNQILHNIVRNNGPFSGIAVVANTTLITKAVPPYPSGNIIKGNLVADNDICFADIGIRVEGPGATGTQVLSNEVRGSFQEGIAVHAVNVIDFAPLFGDPPACQNRGFPDPDLPRCPIQNPTNPTNDNVLVGGNYVTGNGFGGPTIDAGPGLPNGPSPESAPGIGLLAFCADGARSDTSGSIVRDNWSARNAGDGIVAGGCPLDQDPASGTFPGVRNSTIKFNTSVNNNQAGCGTLPSTPGCGTDPTSPGFDLRDSTHQITCPSVVESEQAICAGLGYAPPPEAPAEFVGTPVIQPGGTPCGTNTWFGNRYVTAFPACTTAGGKQVAPAPPPALRSAIAAASRREAKPFPLRGGRR